jgi:hypothetical protein
LDQHLFGNLRFKVPNDDLPLNATFDDASSRLAEGLKNCRAVVKHYRAIIAKDEGLNDQAQCENSDVRPPDRPGD